MKDDIDKMLKNFYMSEVSQKRTPPMPLIVRNEKKQMGKSVYGSLHNRVFLFYDSPLNI